MLGSGHNGSAYNPFVNPMAYVFNNSVATSMANSMLNQVNKAAASATNNQNTHSSSRNSNSTGSSAHNGSSSSSSSSVQEQIRRYQAENTSLQRKILNKGADGQRIQEKITKLETELHSYRKLIEQVNLSLRESGTVPPALQFALYQLISSRSQQSVHNSGGKKGSGKGKGGRSDCFCDESIEKPYLCEWNGCGKRFRSKNHLDAHGNVHTGRRFTCEWPQCGKSFCRKYSLVEHTKMHTGNANLCTYPGCNTTFSSKYGLLRHQNNQHGLNM